MVQFTGQSVEAIARATQFVQRASKLKGLVFLQVCVFGFIEKKAPSLNDLAQGCADLGVEISPQGLDQRITPQAVAFLKAMFVQALACFQSQLPLPLGILQQFTGIYITDSSVIALPDHMVEAYAGCGGKGPKASVKVQLVFEFLRGNLAQVALRAGREPDQAYRDYISVLPQGALVLMDLGYFCLDALQAIMARQHAYFLTRLMTRAGLLTPAGAPIPLLTLLQSRPRAAFEIPVRLGQRPQHRLPCRLIVLPVSQEVADRRRQKAQAAARRNHSSVRQETLALMSWTLFVTNVPATMLPLEHVAHLYAVRWQIELVFKLWKSYGGLKHIADFRRERVWVELYAKMIGLVLTQFLVAPLRMPRGAGANREISPVKVRKIFQRFARDLCRALGHAPQFQAVLAQMLWYIERFGFKEKRRKQPNVCHALALVSAMCGLDVPLEQQACLA